MGKLNFVLYKGKPLTDGCLQSDGEDFKLSIEKLGHESTTFHLQDGMGNECATLIMHKEDSHFFKEKHIKSRR